MIIALQSYNKAKVKDQLYLSPDTGEKIERHNQLSEQKIIHLGHCHLGLFIQPLAQCWELYIKPVRALKQWQVLLQELKLFFSSCSFSTASHHFFSMLPFIS